ncbi:MAG: hypothetical protein K2M79_00560 [Muribaculaceae bacterium]|nr:hypothetical protein [Muribaculaceae bacterium]
MRKRTLIYLAGVLAWALLPSGCKPSQEHYKAAYERAMRGGDAREQLDSTIYGKLRKASSSEYVVSGTDTADVVTRHVRITADGGGIAESLKPFSVVAGKFKQKFNAMSLRERLVEGGFPGAFIVETSEPYYFILSGSYRTMEEAMAGLRTLKEKSPVALREPIPYILRTGR